MNAKEISLKVSPRLTRIKVASRFFRWFNGIVIAFMVYAMLAFCFGWPAPAKVKLIADALHHAYQSRAEMPAGVLVLLGVKIALGIFRAVVLNNLFTLYERGIFFAARNVNYIRLLGYSAIIGWTISYFLQFFQPGMVLSATSAYVGLMLIFVAWIMDEGRKIQEEQALTV
jgi:hypothetical protein